MLKRSQGKEPPSGQESSLSPLLEPLLAVHSAPDAAWLVDAAMTAAERGVGALYGFLYLGDESGRLRGEEPASRERMGPLARVNQLLGTDVTRLEIEPEALPAVAQALRDGRAISVDSLADILPLQLKEKQAAKAQRQLGVSEIWLAPIRANNETMGLIVLLLPANHTASIEVAEALGRHVAVALVNLREGEAARKRGELDVVRWIHDERKFVEQLSLEVQRAVRHERPLSLLLVRMDSYGELRRRHGRFLAERVLRRVAATMEDAMRATDFLGAFKDHGFASILVEADEVAASNAKSRLLATLGNIDLLRANLPGLDLQFSCATVTMEKSGATAEDLLAAADQLLGNLPQEQVA
jgi:diguanylate cyclase (GGDEF)-like protein